MFLELHVIENGVDRGPLPSAMGVTISPVFCDFGNISFKYPRNGKKFALLDGKDEIEVVPWIDGVAHPEFGGLVQEISGDDVAEVAIVDYSGLGYLRLIDEARVYPYNWPSFDATDPSWHFTDATAGEVVGALGLAARNRGTIVDVTMDSFTNTTDSNGVAWAKQITIEVKPGATLVDVLNSLHENDMVEFEMVGRDLRLYNIDTFGTDRTVQSSPVVFRKGRDLKDSPRKISSRDRATVLLAAGKEDAGIYHEEVDATAEATVGRRIEGYVSNGNITDAGTLNAFSEAELSVLNHSKMEKTHGLLFSRTKSPRPIRDFGIGDWCWSDVGRGMEKLRVKQWVLQMDEKGAVTGSVTLNDMFAEAEEKLAKRIQGIVGGSTITGESKASDVPIDVVDRLAPAVPAAPTLSSTAYVDDQGHTAAQVTASWPAVTANADGTVLEDLSGYFIRWRYLGDDDTQWRSAGFTESTFMSWSPLVPTLVAEVSLEAVDRAGNASGWSPNSQIIAAADTTPPEAPAAPTVGDRLGMVEIRYNAETASGAAWPEDLSYFRVHASLVNDFTPDDTTLIDTVVTAGSSFFKANYGATVYAKLEAVDNSGNISPPSAQGSGSAAQVVSSDIFAGAVGSAQLADLAVTTAKINDLAVNSAKVGSLDVGKLSSGTATAEIVIGNRITTALTGGRTEMNALGFMKFAADGVTKMIDFTGVTNLLTGTLQTDLAPNRRIVIGASGGTGKIQLIAPDGTISIIQSSTLLGGAEGFSFSVPISGTSDFWNSFRIDSTGLAFIDARYTHFAFGGVPGGGGDFLVAFASSRGNSTTQPTLVNRLWIDEHGATFYDEYSIPRIWIDSTTNNHKYWSDGSFIVSERGRGAPNVEAAKMIIKFDSINFYRGLDQDFHVYDRVTSTQLANRFSITRTDVNFQWPNVNYRAAIRPSDNSGNSALLQLIHQSNFGVTFCFRGDALGNGGRGQIADATNTIYIPLWASDFVPQSTGKVKKDIGPLDFDPLEKANSAPIKKWTRKPPKSADGKKEATDVRTEYGWIAEEAPEEVRVYDENGELFGLSLSSQMGLVIGSIQALTGLLKALDGRLAVLEGK